MRSILERRVDVTCGAGSDKNTNIGRQLGQLLCKDMENGFQRGSWATLVQGVDNKNNGTKMRT
jgi:hypothetical protein